MAYGGDYIRIIIINDIIGGVSCLPGEYHSFEVRMCSKGSNISDSLEDEIAESKYIYPMLLDMVNVDRCINLIELLILIELEID